jgi:hypothetical protein
MRTYRAGQAAEDYCRQCHEDRMHTVIVVDGAFQPIRARCDFCGSEHNYRGGPRGQRQPATGERQPAVESRQSGTGERQPAAGSRQPDVEHRPTVTEPLVSARERRFPAMSHDGSTTDLETLIRTIIREESGLTAVTPADKWRGGELVLRPGKPGLQEKSLPIDTFFHKIVMLRNRLRTLEQQVNASELPDDQKVKLQAYITGCYGSLTSFNVLFADEEDKFIGAAGD